MDSSMVFSGRRSVSSRRAVNADKERPVPEADPNATGASYMSHLSTEDHEEYREVTERYQLAIFHYMTGAENTWLDRKYETAGKFTTTFEDMVAAAPAKDRREVLQQFEADLGFDGEHALCQEGAALADAISDAKAREQWSPFPEGEGLLFSRRRSL